MKDSSDSRVFELIKDAKEGSRESLSKLVEENTGLIWSVVRRFQNRGYEPEDLFQIGSIGLIKAINKFDMSFGVKFSTYAVPMIIGEIRRFLRDDGIIKVSRSLKETAYKAKMARETIQKESGREPSVGEIAGRLGLPVEELVMSLEATTMPESLYSTVNEGDTTPILLIDRVYKNGAYGAPDVIDRIVLREMLDMLEPREKQIIFLRYFKEKTQVQVAKMLGISQVQVSRIEKKILGDLRRKIEG